MRRNVVLGEKINISTEGKWYPSVVQAIKSPSVLIISTPTHKTEEVALHKGDVVKAQFFREDGVYSFYAKLLNCYQRDFMSLWELRLEGEIDRKQVREFVRIKIGIPFTVLRNPQNGVKFVEPSSNARFPLYRKSSKDTVKEEYNAITKDISAGGLQFASIDKYEPSTTIICRIKLDEELFEIKANVVRVFEEEIQGVTRYVTSVKFIQMPESNVRKIIKFIFHHQAKLRGK